MSHINDPKLIAIKIANTTIVTTPSIISESEVRPKFIMGLVDGISYLTITMF